MLFLFYGKIYLMQKEVSKAPMQEKIQTRAKRLLGDALTEEQIYCYFNLRKAGVEAQEALRRIKAKKPRIDWKPSNYSGSLRYAKLTAGPFSVTLRLCLDEEYSPMDKYGRFVKRPRNLGELEAALVVPPGPDGKPRQYRYFIPAVPVATWRTAHAGHGLPRHISYILGRKTAYEQMKRAIGKYGRDGQFQQNAYYITIRVKDDLTGITLQDVRTDAIECITGIDEQIDEINEIAAESIKTCITEIRCNIERLMQNMQSLDNII